MCKVPTSIILLYRYRRLVGEHAGGLLGEIVSFGLNEVLDDNSPGGEI